MSQHLKAVIRAPGSHLKFEMRVVTFKFIFKLNKLNLNKKTFAKRKGIV